jgi:hypothetical protein
MNLFLDIETIPSQKPGAVAKVLATIKPPGTLKKPESIAAWWATDAADAAEDAYLKQALDGGSRGEIVSIAVTNGEGLDWVQCRGQGDSEAALLQAFFGAVEDWQLKENERWPHTFPCDDHTPIAHNAQFDLGFLWRRAVVLGVRIPCWLRNAWPQGRAGQHYNCTMQAWAGFGKFVRLPELCDVLALPNPKDGGMDGAGVYDAWLAGQSEAIAAYNMADAQAVAGIWHKLQAVGAV